MLIIGKPITVAELRAMAAGMFGNLVVDVERALMAVDAEMHADEEAALLGHGSRQADLWGINLHPDAFGRDDFIEFDSIINLRPSQGNRSRSVEDQELRARVTEIVGRLVVA